MKINIISLNVLSLSLWILAFLSVSLASGDSTYLIKNGENHARIVVAPDAPRMVTLAASELSEYLEKMTGAKIPILHEPASGDEVNIYIGRSEHTDGLGIKDDDLKYGAFRMVSGPDWLVLLGQDWDYESPGIDDESWANITGKDWKNPIDEKGQFNSEANIWSFDEGGSLYAVYEYLRRLGFRWFMPGELGVIIPESKSVELTAINETVHPDFPVRYWIWAGSRFANFPKEDILFDRRVGAGSRYEVIGNTQLTHGIRNVHSGQSMRKNHPEYFALVGTERDTTGKGTGHVCFSSEGFQGEVVAYGKAVFDHMDVQLVQLSPQDGFRQCECADCAGMSPSDNVFSFLDRVARELLKTHPEKKILSAAYSSYREPPSIVEELSPNVIMSINNVGRPRFLDEARWLGYQNLVNDWKARLGSKKILRVENALYDADPYPAVHPRAIARDLSAMRGVSLGERNEWRVNRDLPGATHLNRYIMGRLYWDAGQDVEALLDDYYTKFYGPAAAQMKEALDFAEANPFGLAPGAEKQDFHSKQLQIVKNQITFWKKINAAHATAGDTIYGKRIAVLQSEAPASLTEMDERLNKLVNEGDPRANATKVVARDLDKGGVPEKYRLRGLRDGDKDPDLETSFTVTWSGKELVLDISCEEPDMQNLQSSNAVTLGDNIAILIETPFHSHYHIEVNPRGDVFDKSWNTEEDESWSSQAIVETSRQEKSWSAKVRIPIKNLEDGQGDPLHFVVGEKPTADQPWFFNLGRVRTREGSKEAFLFSPIPAGRGNFHQPARFARLLVEDPGN